ncbi:MAG: neutral/alkaline non-lysosomal ceramidase N-terminal domain-containing protein, partial [Lentisphaerae bacterium]|nr:neutral/alkaline non-lysosomal ceramidase N-terminal domain-containing protein [Lentisphaerota bacterium]
MNSRSGLRAGFARTDITPELGVRLGGYGVEARPAEEIADRLQATAMVWEQGGLAAAVINLDWICIEECVVQCIRDGVTACTGIAQANVTVSTTHSHSVPNTLNFWGWGEVEQAYIDAVFPEIIRSVELAFQNLQEVRVGFASTESLAGVNRRG